MKIEGGCYCKRIRYRVDGEPVVKGQCFCRECQHVTGGGPATLMGIKESDFAYFSGTPKTFARSDLDTPVARDFCPECGTHLSLRSPRTPGVVLVKVGTLDDPAVYGKPGLAVYLGESYPYHAVPEGVPVFEKLPPRP
jgi:Uncharacterized conserved protein